MHLKLIWSSGKILEYTIRSMISRQLLNEDNRLIQRAWKTGNEVEKSIYEVIRPLRPQMEDRDISVIFKNLLYEDTA